MFDRKTLRPAATCNTCGTDDCLPEFAFNDADWFVCDRWQLAEETFEQVCHDAMVDCDAALKNVQCQTSPECRIVETDKGNVGKVHGFPNPSPESQDAIEALIDAASEHMRSDRSVSEKDSDDDAIAFGIAGED